MEAAGSDFSAYIFGWLVGYSALLGPIAGVMIADYFIVRGSATCVSTIFTCAAAPTNTRMDSITEPSCALGARVSLAL